MNHSAPASQWPDQWPEGPLKMAHLIRRHDWVPTPLGPVEGWPERLKALVDTMFSVPQAMWIGWGPDLIQIYNDGYRVLLDAERHGAALGRPARETWADNWSVAGPMLMGILAGGPTVAQADRREVYRHEGEIRERFFSYSFSPIPDPGAPHGVGGVLCVAVETTSAVLQRQSEARLQSVLGGMDEAFGLMDRDFRILTFNEAALRLEARPLEEILGRTHWEVYPGSEHSEIGRLFKRALFEQQPVSLEHRYTWEDGTARWLEMRAYPVPEGLAVFWHDISERKETEAERAGLAQRTAEILESISDAFYAVDRDWRFTYVNCETERWWGRSREDLLGKVYWEEFPQAVGSEPYKAHLRAMKTREVVRLESVSPILHHWVDISIFPTPDGGLSVYFRDISEKKRTDAALRESEARFRLMADAVPQIVWVTDAEGRVEFFNRQWSDYTGVPYEPTTAAEVAAHHVHPDDGAATIAAFNEARRTGTTFLVEHRIPGAAGDYRWFLVRAEPYRDPETGEIVRWFGASVDILDRRLAEAELRESEERFRAIVETATDYAIFTTETDGRITTWPPGAQEIFGWSAEEAVGQSMEMTYTPEDRAAEVPAKERQEAREKGLALNVRWHVRKDGSRVFIDGVARPLRGADGTVTGFVKVGQDVTERRATEEALRESEARFRQFGDATADVLWIRDAETLEWEYISPAFEEVYGASRDSILGRNHVRRWLEMIVPEDQALALDHLRRVREGEHVLSVFRILRGDGEVRWIRDTGFPILDKEGRVQRIAGIGHDATEEVELQDRLRILVAELQHRSRNLVTVVQGVSERTIATSETLDDFRSRFRARLAALGRVNSLLSRLKEGDRITFDQLLRTELTAHGVLDGNGHGEQVSLSGPKGVRLRSATVQTFALALHELATNALKYGALSRPEGRLEVTWSLEPGKGNERRLRVEWRERGVPLEDVDDAPQPNLVDGTPTLPRQGYGRELIERALPFQLKAQVRYDLAPEGARCTIIVPVSSTLDVAFSSQGNSGDVDA